MKRLYLFILLCFAAGMVIWAQSQTLTISSATQFKNFAAAVNSGDDFAGCTVVLTADIELNENEDWIPIGTTYAPFQGCFDGQGHCVSNMYVNVEGLVTDDVAGLFGCIGEQGIVRRVGVESGIVRVANKSNSTVNCYVGGIAGLCEGHIEQCANFATVLGNQTMAFLGGIAGALGNIGGGMTYATIEDCYNCGRIFTSATNYADQNYLAGIVGICDGAVSRVYVGTDVEISTATQTDRIANLSIISATPENAYYTGDMTGSALDGSLNTQGDYSVWTFADGELPQLTVFIQPILLGDVNGDGIISLADVTSLVNLIKVSAPATPNADVSHDGTLSIDDVAILVEMLLTQE